MIYSDFAFTSRRIYAWNMLDQKKPVLDQAFIDGMRQRIDVAMIIDKLQNHVRNPAAHPLKATQLESAKVLLKKVIPDVQQTEIKGGQELGAAFAAAMKASDNDQPI